MYHQAINGLVHGLLFNDEPRVESFPQLLASILVMALAIGLATVSYVFMERPIRAFGRRMSDQFRNDRDSRILTRAENTANLMEARKISETGT